MLRRAGEVLSKSVGKPCSAARIGGDEFAILMPATDEHGGAMMMENIQNVVEVNNQFYAGPRLSFSMGAATGGAGERMEALVKRADARMYEAKYAYYASQPGNRRRDDVAPR